MTAEGVCLIIKASAEAKVTKIKFGSLEVSFGTEEDQTQLAVPEVSPEQHEQMNEAQLVKDTEELREQRMRDLLLEDPLAYEEALHSGELKIDASPNWDANSPIQE